MGNRKFNWGHGIFIFYSLFVVTVLMVLVASTRVDHSLVTKDYYAKDLAYQSQFEMIENDINDRLLTILHKDVDQEITFTFKGEGDIIGHILFYRPADQSLDFSISIENKIQDVENNRLTKKVKVDAESMLPGKWIIKAEWKNGDKSYYKETNLFI